MDPLIHLNLNKRYGIKEDSRQLDFLPAVFRMMVVGSSGCGKTNLILNVIMKIFEVESKVKLFICSKTLEQELYQSFINETKSEGKHEIEISNEIKVFNEAFFKSLDKTKRNIILIDDMLGVMDQDDRKTLIHLFSASRPRKLSIIFLSQRYTKMEISCRRNLNYLILFKPSMEEATSICNELLGGIYDSPKTLVEKFGLNSFFSLFFDLDKLKVRSVYEVFKLSNHKFYTNINDLVEKLSLLIGEQLAGNDSFEIENQIKDIGIELDNRGYISI